MQALSSAGGSAGAATGVQAVAGGIGVGGALGVGSQGLPGKKDDSWKDGQVPAGKPYSVVTISINRFPWSWSY